MKKSLMFILAVFLLNLVAYSQNFGTADFGQIMDKYERSQNVTDLLRIEYEKKQEEINKLQKSLEDRRDALEEGRKNNTISEEEFKKQQGDFQVDVIGFQRKVKEFETELKEKEQSYFESIKSDIYASIKKIADRKKIVFVVEKGVVHFGGIDITEEVIQDLNKK
ncbi:MAG: OmpH family outer membrane protein [Candidatus Muiribacteriota bacterium]